MVLNLHYTFDGTKLAKAEQDQKQFKSYLNEITKGNQKNKSEDRLNTTKNIKIFTTHEKKFQRGEEKHCFIKS